MSIRQGILALLAEGPKYGAQLRTEFEARTGGTWPLNVGQVYTTLNRLDRDGLVSGQKVTDPEGRLPYTLTETGRAAVEQWWSSPVSRSDQPRNELTIKLALAVAAGVEVTPIISAQRTQTQRNLQQLTKLKAQADEASDLAWLLVLDNLLFTAEAEIKWLDHIETRLVEYTYTPKAVADGISVEIPEDQPATAGA